MARKRKKNLQSIMVMLEKKQHPQETAEVRPNTMSWCTKNIGGGRKKPFVEYNGDTS